MLRIREVREAQKMTQQGLADAANISRANISRYETGDRNPSIRGLINISKALNVSVDELIRDADNGTAEAEQSEA